MSNVYQLDGEWIFITPVGNLVLTDEVKKEFRIDRVLLVDKQKLARIRRRLGINTPLSEVKRAFPHDGFFENADTFAIVRHKGKPAEIKNICYRLVKDELSILALSGLGYSKRRFTGYIDLLGEHEVTKTQHFFLNKDNRAKIFAGQVTRNPRPFVLDGIWRNYQREMFFFKLLQILRKDIHVSRAWRNDLTRASILIGQSINSNDIATSFLWNMIALELLLTNQGDKYANVLPKRIEAFLGWIGFWDTENYEERIEQLYKKRSAFVHDGNREGILKKDLLFSDDLLLNLLLNIVNYIHIFSSKDKIIDFSEKVEAEHKLGLASKVRPKKLIFVSRHYSKEDIDEI